MKPFSAACEENKGPILAVLQRLFDDVREVLEVGSGTGQHAVYFAAAMPHLRWHTSDREENHAGIRAWLEEKFLPNIEQPLALDVNRDWPQQTYDALFSANTVHIMPWPAVQRLFAGAGKVLRDGGLLVLYGPFNFAGAYTSESNRRFDAWLKQRDPASGIRNFEALDALAGLQGLEFEQDIEMPVNNRILVWRKRVR
jgi:predicted O-methyltransferase YrrM